MSFWQNKKVLVTGADGFLGSNLIKYLIDKEAKVVSFSRHSISDSSLLTIEGLTEKITQHELGSVVDFERLNGVVKQHEIEIIFHLAAMPLVEEGQSNPIASYQVNVAGTWNVLESARQNRVQKIIAVSTAHVYGDNPNLPFQESYYPQPSRPYETSKACADLIAQSYADSFDLNVEIPRLVNTYGPGDRNSNRLVPQVIRTVLEGKNPRLWDTGAVRDFLFVSDAVTGLIASAEYNPASGKRNRIFNFGSGSPIKIVELAKMIVAINGNPMLKVEPELPPSNREKEILKQYVAIEKAKTELGWEPKISLEQGLKETIDWYRKQ